MTTVHARRFYFWLLLVVLLAFGLRLYALDRQDIWGDEAFSIWISSQPLPDVVGGGVEVHPPLYPFLLYLWQKLAGITPLAVRLLSALLGTMLVPVVYVLARRVPWPMAGDRRGVSLLATLLTAVSPALVYYSQETRMYSLVTLLAAVSLYGALRFLRDPRSAGTALACWAAGLAAAYTHYYAFFVILAENLVVLPTLWHRRRERRGSWADLARWLAFQGGIALAYLPWIAVQSSFLDTQSSARFGEWNLSTALRIAGETLTVFAAGLAVPPLWAWVIAALFAIAAVAGLALLVRKQRALGALLVACLLLPLLLAWAVNPIMPFFYPRYLLLVTPAFYLLAAWGAFALRRVWPPLGAIAALALLAGSGLGLASYYGDETHVRGRYGQMMAYVEAHARSGDALLLANPLQQPLYEYYRPEGMDAYYVPRHEYPLEDPRTARDLEAIASRHPRLWLVRFGNPAEYDPDGYLARWLGTHGSRSYFGGWLDAELALYVMTPAGASDEIQHPLRVDLGGRVRLLGYALGAGQVAPGETLLLTLYWQALAPMDERYTVFTHLLDGEGQIQAQMDGEPQGGGLPTDRWQVGQVVQDNYALEVLPQARPGPHLLEVGMYLLATMERLPVRDPDSGADLGDRVILGTIEVTP